MKQLLKLDEFYPRCIALPPKKAYRPLRLELLNPIDVYDESNNHIVTLPQGFISDGASVPNFFHRVFPPFGMYLGAAFVHDYWCEQANKTGEYHYREWGDQHFKEWAMQCGVRSYRATPMASSVITYGKYLKLTGKLK